MIYLQDFYNDDKIYLLDLKTRKISLYANNKGIVTHGYYAEEPCGIIPIKKIYIGTFTFEGLEYFYFNGDIFIKNEKTLSITRKIFFLFPIEIINIKYIGKHYTCLHWGNIKQDMGYMNIFDYLL